MIYEGRVYGFPTNVGANAIWVNKDLFDRRGVPYPKSPWTWKDFVRTAQRLTIRDANGRAKQFGVLSLWGCWQQFVWQWGGAVYTKDGTRCVVDSPEAVAAIQFLYDLT